MNFVVFYESCRDSSTTATATMDGWMDGQRNREGHRLLASQKEQTTGLLDKYITLKHCSCNL